MIATAKQMQIQGVAGLLPGEISIDLFAGGGGASLGIEWALGISPAEAVNHDEHAIAMHKANHPDTRHHRANVFVVDIDSVVEGRKVGLLHASPDCTYHSVARGGKPMRHKQIRTLPWVVVRWMAACAPRVVTMENVGEFIHWGPLIKKRDRHGNLMLDRDGEVQWVPDRKRRGKTFREFISQMRALGYAVEWRTLNAADYGAPTARRRFFLVARRDGLPICWPKKTHGPNCESPHRIAAECIDWSIPCPSIFLTRAEARAYRKATGIAMKRPLAEKTMRRIAEGVRRYVLDHPNPFIVRIGQTGGNGHYTQDLEHPLTTITTKAEHCLVVPLFAQINHGIDSKTRESNRVSDLRQPLGTITGSRGQAVVAAFLAKHNGGTVGQSAEKPLDTITCTDTKAVIAASLVKMRGTSHSADPAAPAPTVSAGGQHLGLVACHLTKAHSHGWDKAAGKDAREPMGTIVGKNEDCMVAAHLTKMNQNSVGQDPREPLDTVMAGATRFGVVAAFLQRYNSMGANVAPVDKPAPTITGVDRLGLVTVEIEGGTYAISDIGMRMFNPRELANCQGFPDSYLLTGSKKQQVERIGNSVCPHAAQALIAANLCLPVVEKPKRRRRAVAAA